MSALGFRFVLLVLLGGGGHMLNPDRGPSACLRAYSLPSDFVLASFLPYGRLASQALRKPLWSCRVYSSSHYLSHVGVGNEPGLLFLLVAREWGLAIPPSTLNPKPQALKANPQTLTRNPKPLNPEP